MRLAFLLLVLGLVGLLVADGLSTDTETWSPAPAEAPRFEIPAGPVDDHDQGHTHQNLEREWCRMSVGDTDGDGYAEQIPCDPETRAAAAVALNGLHDGPGRVEVAP